MLEAKKFPQNMETEEWEQQYSLETFKNIIIALLGQNKLKANEFCALYNNVASYLSNIGRNVPILMPENEPDLHTELKLQINLSKLNENKSLRKFVDWLRSLYQIRLIASPQQEEEV